MGYLSRSLAVPVIAILCALVGVLTQWRVELTRQRTYDAIAMLALVFVVKYMLLPDNSRYMELFPSQPIALSVGEFALVLQSLTFFVKRRDDRLPFVFPGMGVIALACAAIVEVNMRERMMFQSACVVFVLLAALYCSTSRRFVAMTPGRRFGRQATTALVLSIAATTAWCSATGLHRYERAMDLWVQRYLMDELAPQSVGLSNSAMIGSVSLQKMQNSQAVALRVSSATQPDYFRGRVFSVYQNSQWSTVGSSRSLVPTDQRPATISAARHAGRDFSVTDATDTATSVFEVWPADGLAGSFPAPLGTAWLQAECLDVSASQHNVLQSHTGTPGAPYSIHIPTQNSGQTARTPDESLSQPPAWAVNHRAVAKLASSVFANCQTTEDRLRAVSTYFSGYQYSLEVTVPDGWRDDPVAWFLLEKPPAHCEFFASGSAVLLRLAGIPCRYVTGFVFTDRNDFSGEWIARNRDAHAWVEAWDAENARWVTVESTPGSGVPRAQPQSKPAQLSEYLSQRFQQLRMRWRQEGIRLIGHLVLSALLSPVGLGLFGTALVVSAFILQRRIRRRGHRSQRPIDKNLEPLHTVLQIVDRSVERCCRRRTAGETLTAFADDLARWAPSRDASDAVQQVAAWYRTYAQLRYGPTRRAGDIDRIRQSGQELARHLRGTAFRTPGSLPTKADFSPGNNLDALRAWKNFGGLSLDDAYAKFCELPDVYQEDFMFMGGVAFAYYFAVVERYVLENRLEYEDDVEVEAIWILAHCIRQQFLEPDAGHIQHLHGRILELTQHVRTNLSEYCVDPAEQKRLDCAWQELEAEVQAAAEQATKGLEVF